MQNNFDPQIAILLSIYNGSSYLQEQLDSLLNQSYKNLIILVRDDGSVDSSIEIVKSYSKILNIIILEDSQNIGVKKSFSYLLKYAIDKLDSTYFMFCDQDDIWKTDKVEKTLLKIIEVEKFYKNKPILIHSDLKLVDNNLNEMYESFWKFEKIDPKKNSFNNLLLQNTITGCTVMINKSLAEKSIEIPESCIMHDWWIGLVASYFGVISYIDDKTILYRQHESNTIGAQGYTYTTVLKKIFAYSRNGDINKNIAQAKIFLDKYKDDLDEGTLKMLLDFSNINSKSFIQRRIILVKYRLWKQGIVRNLGLLIKI